MNHLAVDVPGGCVGGVGVSGAGHACDDGMQVEFVLQACSPGPQVLEPPQLVPFVMHDAPQRNSLSAHTVLPLHHCLDGS